MLACIIWGKGVVKIDPTCWSLKQNSKMDDIYTALQTLGICRPYLDYLSLQTLLDLQR